MRKIAVAARVWFAVAVGVAAWAAGLGAQTTAATPLTIPAAKGATLAGMRVVLPDAVKGKVGVLVVGFTRPSQAQVQAWGKRLAADYPAASGVVYYEIPVLASAPLLVRPVIESEMKVTVSAAERAHFLPMTQDEAGWLAVTHYVKGDDAYVLLIAGDGAVRWQTQGPVTDANYAELKVKIAEMQAAMGAAGH